MPSRLGCGPRRLRCRRARRSERSRACRVRVVRGAQLAVHPRASVRAASGLLCAALASSPSSASTLALAGAGRPSWRSDRRLDGDVEGHDRFGRRARRHGQHRDPHTWALREPGIASEEGIGANERSRTTSGRRRGTSSERNARPRRRQRGPSAMLQRQSVKLSVVAGCARRGLGCDGPDAAQHAGRLRRVGARDDRRAHRERAGALFRDLQCRPWSRLLDSPARDTANERAAARRRRRR